MQSATYTIGHEQRDGRRYVQFNFVLDTGESVRTERGPLTDTMTAALDTIRDRIGAEIEAALVESETEALLGDPAYYD